MGARLGTIRAMKGEGSLFCLLLEDEEGERRWYCGDRRPTLQALEALYGTLPIQQIVGQKVGFKVTDYGALESLQDPDTVTEDDS